MITSAISSVARLSLAPAKLAGQMAQALVRGLREDGSGARSSGGRSAGATPARRSRAQTQTKRASTRSSGKQQAKRGSRKQQPKRTAAPARTKRQPSTPRSERTPARTSEPARPERADSAEPLGDVAIAREVESTIFRDIEADRDQVDVNVAEGVVRLRGEVDTPDLIRELEERAAGVPQVRRVENLLRTPAQSPEPETQHVDQPSAPGMAGGAPAPLPTEGAGGTRALRTGRWGEEAERPAGAPGGAREPVTGRQEGDEPANLEEPADADADKDPAAGPGTGARTDVG